MTTESPKNHFHNCRIYRRLELSDASVKFLGFITAFGKQAKKLPGPMRVYDRNFEIMLATPHMFNAPSRWNDAWPRVPTTDMLKQVISRAPATCTQRATLHPDQAVWLPDNPGDFSSTAQGVMALSFKDPNVTLEESRALAGIISELSGGTEVLTKDSAGSMIFASSVPRHIGSNVVRLMNTESKFMNQPFTFEPAEYLGPRVKN